MLDKITYIAKEAGNIIRKGFKQNYTIKYKSSEIDLVTSIDEASEKCVIDFIKKEFPTHGILSEESGNVKTRSEERRVGKECRSRWSTYH